MAELPQMPWFPRDYQADTRHLTLEEHGAYRMLLDLLWIGNCTGLPSDEKRLSRMLGITVREWKKISAEVLSFFYEKDDGLLSHTRVEKEWARISKRVEQNRQNARGKPLEDNEDGEANGDAKQSAKPAANDKQNASKTDSKTPLTQNQNQTQKIDTQTTHTESVSGDGAIEPPPGGGDFENAPFHADPRPCGEQNGEDLCDIPKFLDRRHELQPTAVIKLFDDLRAHHFGEPMRRPFPNGKDLVYAQRWIAAGATLDVIRGVLDPAFAARAAKKDDPVGSLSYFDRPIGAAISVAKTPVPDDAQADPGTHQDAAKNQWVGRVKAFRRDGFWPDSYGPNPDEPGCECPKDVLKQYPAKQQAEG